jgi:hypothetical protein
VELITNNLFTNSVLSKLGSGLTGLLDASSTNKVFGDLASDLDASVSLLDFSGLALFGTLSVNSHDLVGWAGSSDTNTIGVVAEVSLTESSATDVSDESLRR